METTETSWTEALDSVKVDFGQTERHDGPLQHERLRRDTGMLIARDDGIAASSRPYTLQTPSPSPEGSDPDTPGPREPGPDSTGKNGPRPRNSPRPSNSSRPSSTSPTPSTPTSEAACDAASADPAYTISLRGGPQSRRPCPPPAGTTALPLDQSLIPTATDLPEAVTINLSQQFNGQDVNAGPTATRGIRPPKSLYAPSSLHVRCDSCSTNGSMIITQGGWNVSAAGFSSGHIDIALADFTAHIQLWIDGLDGTGSMSRELVGDVPIPGAGFRIPGFGRAGLLVRPELFVEWDLAAGAAAVLLNALGFQLRVPPGARVAVDFANASNSRVAGFAPLDVALLPLNSRDAAVDRLDVRLAVGLRLHLLVALASDLTGVYLDLPALSAPGRGGVQ